MKRLVLFILMLIPVLSYSQDRDSTVTGTLRYISNDLGEGLVDTQTEWSDSLSNYLVYSRINMGNRMNEGIKSNKLAQHQFISGTILTAVSLVAFIYAANSDPAIYIEGHSKYTRTYYRQAKRSRDASIVLGSAMAAGAVYLFWRSNKNYKRSRWHISPNGVKYRF